MATPGMSKELGYAGRARRPHVSPRDQGNGWPFTIGPSREELRHRAGLPVGGGPGDVLASGGAGPDHDARFGLLECPPGVLLAPVVVPAGRAQVALAGGPGGPGHGMVRITLGGGPGAAEKVAAGGARRDEVPECAAGPVARFAAGVIAGAAGDRGECDLQAAQEAGGLQAVAGFWWRVWGWRGLVRAPASTGPARAGSGAAAGALPAPAGTAPAAPAAPILPAGSAAVAAGSAASCRHGMVAGIVGVLAGVVGVLAGCAAVRGGGAVVANDRYAPACGGVVGGGGGQVAGGAGVEQAEPGGVAGGCAGAQEGGQRDGDVDQRGERGPGRGAAIRRVCTGRTGSGGRARRARRGGRVRGAGVPGVPGVPGLSGTPPVEVAGCWPPGASRRSRASRSCSRSKNARARSSVSVPAIPAAR